MSNMKNQSSKPLTKEETKALLSLIQESNIVIRNKKMNAATNQMKVQEWIRIAQKFNNTIATCERTPRQLRLKWENLKKGARKRNSILEMNSMADGVPEYIRPDEVLERVSTMLNSTINDCADRISGDSELNDASSCSSLDFILKHHTILPMENVEVVNHISDESNESETERNRNIEQTEGKRKYIPDESRTARDRAIQKYYETKRRIVEELFPLEKEKLKLEIERLKKNS